MFANQLAHLQLLAVESYCRGEMTVDEFTGLMAFGVIGTQVVRPQHVPPGIQVIENQIAGFMEGLAP
jgi:hypothetical protein